MNNNAHCKFSPLLLLKVNLTASVHFTGTKANTKGAANSSKKDEKEG